MKTAFIFAAVILFFTLSCTSNSSNKSNKNESAITQGNDISVVDVDSILASPDKYIEKSVSIKGLVVHTCRHSGKKMFLAGTDKNKFVKVIAGPGISRFDQSLEGETVVATGKLELLDETQEREDHAEKGEGRMRTTEATSQDTATAGCVTETKIRKYQMICDNFKVVE